MNGRSIVLFLKAIFDKWREDRVPQLAAALAYYTAFSFTPLLVILIAIGGLALGKQTVQDYVLTQVRDMLGAKGAQLIQTAIVGITKSFSGIVATAISAVALLFGASRVCAQLQVALDTIWGAGLGTCGRIADTVRNRMYAFLVVLMAGFLLLTTLVINAAVATVIGYFGDYLPGGHLIWRGVDFLISSGMLAVTFAMIFKILPKVKIAWRDVWLGSVASTLLFSVARFLVGVYLHRGALGSIYGAAGTFFVILFWFYCSTHILLFGAECTWVYATRHGSYAVGSGPGRNGLRKGPKPS